MNHHSVFHKAILKPFEKATIFLINCNFLLKAKKKGFANTANPFEKIWRREQESNLHRLTPGSFQDYCNTIMRSLRKERRTENITQSPNNYKLKFNSFNKKCLFFVKIRTYSTLFGLVESSFSICAFRIEVLSKPLFLSSISPF